MAKKIYTDEEARERKNARQREYSQNTHYAAQYKYLKENTKRYELRLMLSTEKDIIEKLEKQENKAGYLKSLIRKDIDENGI